MLWRKRTGSSLTAEQKASFFENGYLILRNLISSEDIEIICNAMDRAWADKSVHNNLTIAAYTSTARYVETYLRNLDVEARSYSYKINHLFLYDQRVLHILLTDKLQGIFQELLEGTPLLFNGLNMERGTEQRYHFDSFYMPPRVKDRLIATWIALEDIHPNSGPLTYYPKSHLIPPYIFSHGGLSAIYEEMPGFDEYIEKEINERGLEPAYFCPKKGDMFIWHSQLYHGGGKIKDPTRSRKSMVNHYWRAEDYPRDWMNEVAPGKWMLLPQNMCVSPDFVSHHDSKEAA